MQVEDECPVHDRSPVDLQWDQDARNPFNWPLRRKWMVLSISCTVTFFAGINSTSITTAGEEVSKDFHLSDVYFEYNFFAVTAWNAAAAFVPLATLPIMETYGMRIGYLIAYAIFTIFLIPQALAQNFATVVVCRAIAGAAGGTLQNAADGVAANLFRTCQERVLPITLYVFSLVFGVAMGPVLGALVEPLGWRWIFWVELIINGALAPVVLLGLRESRGAVIRERSFAEPKEESEEAEAIHTLKETVVRSAILLTTEPTVTSFTFWCAFSYGLVIYNRSAPHNPEAPGIPIPEYILHLSIPSTLLALAGGLFMYGWSTLQPHWIIPAIGTGLCGYAVMVVVNAVSIYITDAYSGYAASAIAAVAFGENTFAAFLPLAAKPMYVRLGYPWASSLLAFIAVALTLAPVTLLSKGRTIRRKSKAIQTMCAS
ncbi:Major Facilitator Superfamily [Aspergillus sclerotialis]|uniref:Major Facilitator Superfamily n=1 Tax=Aspergillus sclerotialis TaxID=2070753 RepID=A0A3A2ZGU7_9EURO|nr:Major Facilitator Superfamily [Aspergillus sclerotialis]